MKRLNVLNSFGVLVILSVALILVSSPAQAYIYDSFPGPGPGINSSLWKDIGPNTGLFSVQSTGGLNFNDPSPGGNVDQLISAAPVSGPFFVSLNYSAFSANNTTTGSEDFSASSVGLWVGEPSDFYIAGYSLKDSGANTGFRANSFISGTSTHLSPKVSASAPSGSLGVYFNGELGAGGVLTLWYNDGAGWTELASADPDFTSDPYFAIMGYDLDGSSLSFKVSEVDIVPLPPTALLLGSGLLGLAAVRLRSRWRK